MWMVFLVLKKWGKYFVKKSQVKKNGWEGVGGNQKDFFVKIEK